MVTLGMIKLQSDLKKSCFLLLFCFVLASCGTTRHVTSNSTAAKAAEVMASLNNKKLYKFITSWTGVKYQLGGLDKRGIDCSGFALTLEKEIFDIDLPRRSIEQAGVIKQKDVKRLETGDLVFFSFGGREVDHVGVYLNDNFFVHASTSRGVIVDDLMLPAYQNSLVSAGSVKNSSNGRKR